MDDFRALGEPGSQQAVTAASLPVPPGWRRIGTFTRLETSLGTFGPGDILLPDPGTGEVPGG